VIRTLGLIAAVSFVLCIGCLAGSFAIGGGPFAIRDWAIEHDGDFSGFEWSGPSHHRWRTHRFDDGDQGEASRATRDITWPGGASLEVEVPADVVYTQGAPARIRVSGPQGMVQALQVTDGRLRLGDGPVEGGRLKIEVTAPDVRRFDLSGDQNLVVEAYRQDRLSLDMSGASRASVKGEARSLDLDIAGSGRADLDDLVLDDATVDISGSGQATLGPRASARIDVSGDGEVTLTTRPKSLTTDVSGAGRIHPDRQ